MSTTPATAPLLAPGELIAGRYRVLEALPGPGPARLWRATDEVLGRSVALKALPAEREAARPFLAAAVAIGAAVHPGLARVHDATLQPSTGGPEVALIIREWVEGRPLDALLAAGAVDPLEAIELVRQAAEALTALHARGMTHGHLHPANLVVTPDGRVKVTDAGIALAAAGRPLLPPAEAGPSDTRDLAALLYALLTARWPATASPQPGGALPPAPAPGSRVVRPRQVRAAVPRALDAVVARALDPLSRAPLTTPLALSAAVQQVAGNIAEQAGPTDRAAGRRPGRWRRGIPVLLVVLLLGGIGTAGWLLGLAVGDLPRRSDAEAVVSTGSTPTATPSPPPAPLDLSALPVTAFDPPPGDGTENDRSVPRAVDGDLDTSWQTSTYKTSHFGNLKGGVGLLVDLGRSRPLSQVSVLLTAAGTSLELRTADVLPDSADGFRTVASSPQAPADAVLTPAAGAVGRYWLVWITELPPAGRGYRATVSELRFR